MSLHPKPGPRSRSRTIWPIFLVLCAGCTSTRLDQTVPGQDFCFHRGPLYVFAGVLIGSRTEPDYGAARFRARNHSGASTLSVTVEVAFYTRTLVGQLPEHALLVLQRSKSGALILLGKDANKSILPDTPTNRSRLLQALAEKTLIPGKKKWLPKEAALLLAGRALGADREPLALVAKRYELGWEISVLPTGPAEYGADRFVVVGDDSEVKMIGAGW